MTWFKHSQTLPLPRALTVTTALIALSIPATAYADDEGEVLVADYCRPAGGVSETLAKFDSLKASKRDTVGPDLTLRLTLDADEAMPERIELRDGETVLPIIFDADKASVGFTDQIRQVSEAASLCIVDPNRAGRARADRGFGVNMNMGVRFKETPGTHSLTQIEDGMKDGRSHYKKMAGAMGFLVPKFDYIAVAGDDDAVPPQVWATANGVDLGEPDYELYDGARMIALKTLEAMGADGVRIEPAQYRMSPSPDAKTVAKFAG